MFNSIKFIILPFVIILAITENIKAEGNPGIQEAWDNPNANMAQGSIKPGYAQLSWSQGSVLPIKLRSGMVTMITLPNGEEVEDGVVGADELFQINVNKGSRTFYLTPTGSNQGADTNLIVTGSSGNKYLFYLRSEPANSSEITYSQVDIVLEGNGTIQKNSSSNSSYSSGMNSIFKKNSNQSYIGVDGEDYGWIKSVKIDPSEFRFDIDIFVPNPDDYVIAPERVWRDRIFTYIDFGDKVIAMTQRPVVSLLVEGGESPVGFRTDGENGRLLIIEAVGDMVLRSGQRIVCIKRRSKPFLITDTSSVMALAEANVARSMASNQSFNNVGYNNSGININNNGIDYNNQTPQNNIIVNSNYYSKNDTVHMLPTERNTAGSYLPTSGIPLIASNQKGVAIELQSDTSVKSLNDYWTGLLAKFSGDDGKGILTPYKNMVFFAVDEQGVGELGSESVASRLYRLRIGPLKDMDTAQSLCDKLLKFSGTICKIVRVQ